MRCLGVASEKRLNTRYKKVKIVVMTADKSYQDSNSLDRSITDTRESSCYNDGNDNLLVEIQTFEIPRSYPMSPLSDSSKFKKNHLAAMI